MTPDNPLDTQIDAKLRGGFGGLFLSELFQGGGQLALMLLLLELVAEWPNAWANPDPWLLLGVAVGQSAWLARLRLQQRAGPWWSRLVGLGLYVLVESAVEGLRFFAAPHHVSFALLSLVYALGMALETGFADRLLAVVGTVLARLAQAAGPVLYYAALDLHGRDWLAAVSGFFDSSAHAFLLVLALAQAASLVALTRASLGQTRVIGQLVALLKQLSRWGYGDQVVGRVLQDGHAVAASRVQRGVVFIDIRGFTPWSETRSPEAVVVMLNTFYEAVRADAGEAATKTKMAGDEVMLVFPEGDGARLAACAGLSAARRALAPWGLDAGAGLWHGLVVEGFFGAQAAQVHDVIGDTVNTAHRLCGQAAAGQLLWGPASAHVSLAENETRVRLTVKGKTDAIEAVAQQVAIG